MRMSRNPVRPKLPHDGISQGHPEPPLGPGAIHTISFLTLQSLQWFPSYVHLHAVPLA
jgi:hypothetical protein